MLVMGRTHNKNPQLSTQQSAIVMAAVATVAAFHDDHDDWVFPYSQKYKGYTVDFMSFVEGISDEPFPEGTTFNMQQLLSIVPSQVRQWLNFKAYGDPFPPDDAIPLMRAGSVDKCKSGISFYMPNKHVAWVEGHGGNPTRHRSLTELLAKIETMEARGLGVDGKDMRDYSKDEWYKVLELLDRHEGYDEWSHRHKYPTMFLMGYHLAHRCDCSSHFKVDQPHGSRLFPFTIMTKTKWSKNVRNAQQCPDQIILASNRWDNCLILRLAVYLDGWLRQHPNVKFMFTTNDDDHAGPHNINAQFRNRLNAVAWKHPEFVALKDEESLDKRGIGTHSNR